MINLSAGEIVFNVKDGRKLNKLIRAALKLASDEVLATAGLTGVDLDTVTTATNLRAAFPKFVERRVLPSRSRLDEDYVNSAFEAYRLKSGEVSESLFAKLFLPTESDGYAYKRVFSKRVNIGLGLFLVALHSSGAITLPVAFNWPMGRDLPDSDGKLISNRRIDIGRCVASELLSFIRMMDSQSEELAHPAFRNVGGDKKRREWFLTYGTKLLLATGWNRPEDANLADLVAIKLNEKAIGSSTPLAFRALLDVLSLRFGDRFRVSIADWDRAVASLPAMRARARSRPDSTSARDQLLTDGLRSNSDLAAGMLLMDADWGRSENLRNLGGLPGLSIDLGSMSVRWLDIEALYVQKLRRESYKAIQQAHGWLNVYLFYYLPYWFSLNPDTDLTFPRTPSLLLKGLYVSRLLPTDKARPSTLIEFMNAQRDQRAWEGNYLYAILLQLEQFFDFIEMYSSELEGCAGFTQPLAQHDYPRTTRTRNTKKQPLPRRLFGIYLDYHEALIAHASVITARVLAGELCDADVRRVCGTGSVIDTVATGTLVGFVPLLFTEHKTIRLQFIPNVLDIGKVRIRSGRTVLLPHLHALNQNLVALHTGLRGNHIQWLDRDTFDSLVEDEECEFMLLFVNTDKQRSEPWSPHVSRRVIEILRAQREWVSLVDNPAFKTAHYYNDNENTKWPKFRPLFAYTKDGKPHHDSVYAEVWQATLCGLQGLMPELEEYGRARRLLWLLPPGHRPTDSDLRAKLIEYGASVDTDGFCELRVMTPTTPHSARVGVVSQYISFLPTDLIGKYITGQKSGTVTYYAKLDAAELETERVHQASRLKNAAMRGSFEPVLSGGKASSTAIHADAVNSNLARGMATAIDDTLVRFGGMSISFSERAKNGVDVLRESKGSDAAFNKTEICPFGNNCPPDVIKELKGIRRCSLCRYAVRTIDHLPAVVVKKRQLAEMVDEEERVLAQDSATLNSKFTPEELDEREDNRARLCEDLAGWYLSEEVLEVARQQLSNMDGKRDWVVRSPEILERGLRRVEAPVNATEYLLTRLGECIAYPSLESPQIRARFDLLRRELLVRAGNLKSAFGRELPIDPAAECAGLLRSIVDASGSSLSQLVAMLEQDNHLRQLPRSELKLLTQDEPE